jgi:O-antigen ligase
VWNDTAKVALQKPFLGWGYRSFAEKVTGINEASSLGKVENLRAHNDWLHTAQELGFPIVAVVIMFFLSLSADFWNSRKQDEMLPYLATAVLIVLINMSGQTLIRYASVAGTFIIILAFLKIKIYEVRP